MRGRKDESGDRVRGPGQLEHVGAPDREIGGTPRLERAEVGAAEHAGAAASPEPEGVAGGQRGRAVAAARDQQRLLDVEEQIASLVRCRAVDAEAEYAAARTGLAELALSGCGTVFDHHYVFPRGEDGLIEAELQAARELGVRLVASRGSMDLGESSGGLPPDSLVEDLDAILADTERVANQYPGQIVAAPCSPFSVTGRLMTESAEVARRLDLKLHTHLAETVEEEAYCQELYGCRPVEYLEQLGWLSGDVWCAHCVHLSEADVARFAETGTGVAHCPTSNLRLGAGVAPVRPLLDAGVRVGLGVDGSASNERGDLLFDVKQALLVARGRDGPAALTARDALRLATRGGAGVLGRDDFGSLEPGRSADLAVWRTDMLELAGSADPVAGLVLSAPHRVDRLIVGGQDVVRDGALVRASEEEIARDQRKQATRFAP